VLNKTERYPLHKQLSAMIKKLNLIIKEIGKIVSCSENKIILILIPAISTGFILYSIVDYINSIIINTTNYLLRLFGINSIKISTIIYYTVAIAICFVTLCVIYTINFFIIKFLFNCFVNYSNDNGNDKKNCDKIIKNKKNSSKKSTYSYKFSQEEIRKFENSRDFQEDIKNGRIYCGKNFYEMKEDSISLQKLNNINRILFNKILTEPEMPSYNDELLKDYAKAYIHLKNPNTSTISSSNLYYDVVLLINDYRKYSKLDTIGQFKYIHNLMGLHAKDCLELKNYCEYFYSEKDQE